MRTSLSFSGKQSTDVWLDAHYVLIADSVKPTPRRYPIRSTATSCLRFTGLILIWCATVCLLISLHGDRLLVPSPRASYSTPNSPIGPVDVTTKFSPAIISPHHIPRSPSYTLARTLPRHQPARIHSTFHTFPQISGPTQFTRQPTTPPLRFSPMISARNSDNSDEIEQNGQVHFSFQSFPLPSPADEDDGDEMGEALPPQHPEQEWSISDINSWFDAQLLMGQWGLDPETPLLLNSIGARSQSHESDPVRVPDPIPSPSSAPVNPSPHHSAAPTEPETESPVPMSPEEIVQQTALITYLSLLLPALTNQEVETWISSGSPPTAFQEDDEGKRGENPSHSNTLTQSPILTSMATALSGCLLASVSPPDAAADRSSIRDFWRTHVHVVAFFVIAIVGVSVEARLFPDTFSEIAQLPQNVWDLYISELIQHPLATKAAISLFSYLVGDTIAQVVERPAMGGGVDAPRLVRAGVAGAIQGLLSHYWYNWCETSFVQLGVNSQWWSFLPKIALAELVYGPLCNVEYLLLDGVLRGQTWAETTNSLASKIVGITIKGFQFWFAVSCVTYTVVPVEQRVLWVDMCDIVWVSLLSMMNNQAAVPIAEIADSTPDPEGQNGSDHRD